MRQPTQLRAEKSTRRMIDATMQVASTVGLEQLTIAAVAETAGVSNGVIYHRFADRVQLLLAAQDQFLTEVEGQIAEVVDLANATGEPRQAMNALVSGWLDAVVARRQLFRAFSVEGHREDSLRARGTATSHRFAELICGFLTTRFACPAIAAESAYRLLLGLIASSALWGDEQASATNVPLDDLKAFVCEALLAIVDQTVRATSDVRRTSAAV